MNSSLVVRIYDERISRSQLLAPISGAFYRISGHLGSTLAGTRFAGGSD